MRPVRIQEPTVELQNKIIRARKAIANQKPRYIKCPYCHHNAIIVFEDTVSQILNKILPEIAQGGSYCDYYITGNQEAPRA